MGYTTEFDGRLELSIPATPEQVGYINTFSGTRRMKRNASLLEEKYNGKHGLSGVGYGIEGEFFAMDDGQFGQYDDGTIAGYNMPPSTQPGLWCQWVLSDDGKFLEWDGGEKFYNYVEWLKYMIKNFFEPWNIKLNGTIHWRGEEFSDMGTIVVDESDVKTIGGKFA